MRRLLVFAALFAFSATAHASETLSQLITDSRVLVLDSASTTRQRFSDTQITELLNQAQRQAVNHSRCLSAALTFSLTPGVTYYALPSNFLYFERVTVGSKWLQEMTPAALDGRSRGWEASSGYPTYYFINFSSRTQIGFAPWPAASTDTDTVKVEYDIAANDLANSTDIPFNGVTELQEYQHGLAYYAAAIMATIEGLDSQAKAYMSVYSQTIKDMTDSCRERPNYLPSATGSQ
jgi:hypothetical protein